MASAQGVETSVTNSSPFQDSNHPDDLVQSRYVTSGFKPLSHERYTVHVACFLTLSLKTMTLNLEPYIAVWEIGN